jgi:hypothetical protein
MNKENLPLNKKGMAIGRHSKKKWQREQLIVAILQQPTWQKAAASIGISEVTAWRISHTPAFRREYLQASREAMSQSLGRLQQGSAAERFDSVENHGRSQQSGLRSCASRQLKT